MAYFRGLKWVLFSCRPFGWPPRVEARRSFVFFRFDPPMITRRMGGATRPWGGGDTDGTETWRTVRIGYIGGMKPFFTRWLVTTLAVLVVSNIPGVGVRADSVGPLLAAGLLLGILNAFVRPLLLLLSLPLILLTMGLFFFVVNALTLYFVGSVIPGFHVDGFFAALFGSILISIVSWIFSAFIRGSDGRVHVLRESDRLRDGSGMKTVRGRVIE